MPSGTHELQHTTVASLSCLDCVLLSDTAKALQAVAFMRNAKSFTSATSYCYNVKLKFGQRCSKSNRYPAQLVHKLTRLEQTTSERMCLRNHPSGIEQETDRE